MTDSGLDKQKELLSRTRLLNHLFVESAGDIRRIADRVVECFRAGGSVFACGNGGSASQAEHFAAELVGRFAKNRKSLPVFALSPNSSVTTAISNDYSFADVFSRQIEGMARKGDCLFALSTSGASENVVRACRAGRRMGLHVFALTGQDEGPVCSASDIAINVPDTHTARIQEVHLTALHLICQMVEEKMFSPASANPEKV